MSRQTRTSMVVGLALVAASLASLGMYQAVQHLPVVKVQVPAMDVVVAAKPLDVGVRLTKEHLKVVGWPSGSPVTGAFSRIDAVVDRGLVAAVGENEIISESKLAPVAAGAGLPPAIKPGMRAMSVKVNEVVGVAGFVVPGTHVDVLVTIRQAQGAVSRIVVGNVQVLTAGTRYDESQVRKEAKPIPSSVVTLMVTPGDAERIALAAAEGQIMLALRHPLDFERPVTAGIRTATLLAAPAAEEIPATRAVQRERPTVHEPEPLPPPPPAPPRPCEVETIKAGQVGTRVLQC